MSTPSKLPRNVQELDVAKETMNMEQTAENLRSTEML